MINRCFWCSEDAEYIAYHDTEWGIPVRDDRHLFELLCLEGQQAGLSWLVVLRKRAHYRKVFKNFEIAPVSRMKDKTLEALVSDAGLIRNRLKTVFHSFQCACRTRTAERIRQPRILFLAICRQSSYRWWWSSCERHSRAHSVE